MGSTDKQKFPIVILTGAGISQESGLSTFRDIDGEWSKVKIEDVATPDAFFRDPGRVHDFYNQRRDLLLEPDIQPNDAHYALAELEKKWPNDVLIVTQNIDDLHERAGTRNLIHMHGELFKARCTRCNSITSWLAPMNIDTTCPSCGQEHGMRPHVVWFGEEPLMLGPIGEALTECGLFIAIGTSGVVYPAAGFVATVKQFGKAQTIEINIDKNEGHNEFDDVLIGPATKIVPQFIRQLLKTIGE